jgi:acetolactate synthase-1/2/3 large subunit
VADVTGQITRRPAVCVATLGPGALNMTLGVANAFLERSPVIAITATLALRSAPFATHQDLDLNAVYRPFTKMAITLDGRATAARTQRALAASVAPRMGPVHIALPSDVARAADRPDEDPGPPLPRISPATATDPASVLHEISRARRPVAIVGLDVNPHADTAAVRAFVDALGVPSSPRQRRASFPKITRGSSVSAPGLGRRGRARLSHARRSPHRHRVRSSRVRQALASDDEARLDRPVLDRAS